jgi:hypothetical protein
MGTLAVQSHGEGLHARGTCASRCQAKRLDAIWPIIEIIDEILKRGAGGRKRRTGLYLDILARTRGSFPRILGLAVENLVGALEKLAFRFWRGLAFENLVVLGPKISGSANSAIDREGSPGSAWFPVLQICNTPLHCRSTGWFSQSSSDSELSFVSNGCWRCAAPHHDALSTSSELRASPLPTPLAVVR